MKKSQIKFGAILSYVSLFITNVIGLVYTPIMLRLMGQAEYGLYSLVATFIGYLTILDLGFGNAIIVYTSKYRAKNEKKEEEKLHGMFFLIYTIIGIIAGIIGVVLYLNVDNLFGVNFTIEELRKAKIMMGILTFNLVITFPLSIFGNILTAYEEFIFTKILNIVRQLLNPLIMLPLLYMGYKSIAMTVVVTILNVICLLANMGFCIKKLKIKIRFKGFDKILLKEIFGYSFFIFLNIIVDKINWHIDQFVLGAVAGTIAVAVYAVASQINNMYLSFSTSITSVLIPKVTQMVSKDKESKEISDVFIMTGRIQFLVMSLVMTGFILFGQECIYLWGGDGYESSYIIACILMLPVTVPLIQNIGIAILQAMNKNKFRTILYTITSMGNLLISIPLAKLYGGVGSAIGTAITFIIGNIIIMNIYYHKKIKLDIPRFWKNIFKMFIPMGILFAGTYLLNSAIAVNYSWVSILIKIAIYSSVYFALVYRFSMNNYERNLIKGIFNKLKLKKT